MAEGALSSGEWWIVDPMEGNINYVQGMTDWSVTATLVQDNEAVVTAVAVPLLSQMYYAEKGESAFLNGERLHVSRKKEMGAALFATGQGSPGEDGETQRRMGQSITAMMGRALVLRAAVPATLLLVQVAAGRMDIFWQYSRVRSGLLSGALLVTEAGGIVSDTHGAPWDLASRDFLAAAPGVHARTVEVLSTVQ